MKKFLITVIISCLTTAVSEAATYYVAKTGSNSNTCTQAQSQSTPKLTVTSGASCLVAGDTLYIKAGTYSEAFHSIRFPAATSWAAATTVSKYGSDVVTFQGSGNPFNHKLTPSGSPLAYAIFNGFVFDGNNVETETAIATGGANHIRFTNFEVKNWGGTGIMPVDSNEFINCSVHDNAWGFAPNGHGGYAFYISGPNNLIDNCDVYNHTGYGVHLWSFTTTANNNTIRNSLIHGNNTLGFFGAGIIFSSGTGNAAYNNILYGNYGGILAGNNSLIYNNTIHANVHWGINTDGHNDSIIKNNIVYENPDGSLIITGTGNVESNNLTTDPKLVNPSTKDFRLQTGSAAIDAGTDLLSKRLTVDFAGGARPQGCCIDIGAYEYGSQSLVEPPSNPIAPTNLIAGP